MKRWEEFIIYVILMAAAGVLYHLNGENIYATVSYIIGLVGVALLLIRIAVKRFMRLQAIRRIVIKQHRLKELLERKTGWRLAKVAYGAAASVYVLVALLSDAYYDNGEKVLATVARLALTIVLFFVFRMAVFYVYFGKSERKAIKKSDIV